MNIDSELKRVFLENQKSKYIFVKPGGNHGDYLIYFGLEVLAKQLGLRYITVSANEFLNRKIDQNEIVYIHGGGGYNRWCSGSVLAILKHALLSQAKLVIQGPCTIDQDVDYVQNIVMKELRKSRKPELIFFAREYTTHEICDTYFKEAVVDVRLDRDTAFWADKKSLEKLSGESKSNYRFYALREDNESSDEEVFDYGKGIKFDPAYYCGSFEHWIKVHLRAKQIITSRTHSSIIGAILEKPVVLYPSRYHKNRSIWEYTLKEMNVVWGPDGEGVYFSENSILKSLPPVIKNSYKVNRLVHWLQGVPLS